MFITFEGPDGSGKTTQIRLLQSYLEEKRTDLLVTREPGGTFISEKIRSIILDRDHGEMDSVTEALLYAASRAQLVAEKIRPALNQGLTVICDRFVDSSIAYQSYGRGLGAAIKDINQFATGGLQPDLTILIKVEPQVAKARIQEADMDRLEAEKLEFHREVLKGYLALAEEEPQRVKVVDGTMTVEEIHREIISYVEAIL